MILSTLRSGLLLDVLHSNLLLLRLLLCHSSRHARQSGGRGVSCDERHIHGLEHGSNRRHVECGSRGLDCGLDGGAEVGSGGLRGSGILVAGKAVRASRRRLLMRRTWFGVIDSSALKRFITEFSE